MERLTQAERAYQILREAILRGQLAEGSFLSEAELVSKYGIGRTPLREACHRLHQQQLLELVPRRGFQVRSMTFRTMLDLLELRMVLESVSVELAVLRASDEEVGRLEELCRSLHSSPTREELIQRNREFHQALARMTQNQELGKVLSSVMDRWEALSYAEFRSGVVDAEYWLRTHLEVVEALRARNVALARAKLLSEIADTQREMLSHSTALIEKLSLWKHGLGTG